MFSLLVAALCAVVAPVSSAALPTASSDTILDWNPLGLVTRQAVNATPSSWSAPAHREIAVDFPIHQSCNQSQQLQLRRGFFDMKRLLREAADHILLHGNQSELFTVYFGAEANPATPLGIFERILSSDKSDTLFRCDDPDQNCATQDGWNGHWRGNNATGETVICDLSFHTRLPIEKFCNDGFHLADDEVSIYWATDLFHRAMHLPQMTNDMVVHAADVFDDVLTLAATDPSKSVVNQHTLQNFAFEVFTRRHVREDGCVRGESSSTGSTSSTAPAASTTAAAQDCHTHANGEIHCGSH
ncbi:unnamed protein product [Jaminaea pallidilutea]